MKRIFLPELLTYPDNIKTGSLIEPDSKVIHRIKDVLRAEDGADFEFIDGDGLIVQAEFNRKDENFLIKNVNRIKKDNSKELCVAVSIIRRERFDLMVEKAVELGVDRIVPFRSERSRPYSNESYDKLKERWQKIADQALSQCKRDFRCVVEPVHEFKSINSVTHSYHNKIGFDPTGIEFNKADIDVTKQTLFIIGPEGGFTDEELKGINTCGVKFYSISDNILRTETAVFYALSVLKFLSLA